MNYRHGFHAGNFADVHKHILLVALLDHLLRKDTPCCFIDTHAGRGDYDLTGPEASRSQEWRGGIGRLLAPAATSRHADIDRYLAVLCTLGVSAPAPLRYPGSPLIARSLLRDCDRVILTERHPDEAASLRSVLSGRRHTAVLCADGYRQLKAALPPRERRGLVLIDPPYESATEYLDVETALAQACDRWPTGMYAAWYPIKASEPARRLLERLARSGLRKVLCCELAVRPRDATPGLNGSGLLIVNPPWRLDERAGQMQQALLDCLTAREQGSARVFWLVPE